jgi:hypothetical protein
METLFTGFYMIIIVIKSLYVIVKGTVWGEIFD